jgi:hypothetical protein
MTIDVAIEALREDAGEWEAVSADLATQGAAAGGITVPALAFGTLASGAAAAYETAASAIADALVSGGRETAAAAATLRHVATAYQTSDELAAAAFAGEWEVQE